MYNPIKATLLLFLVLSIVNPAVAQKSVKELKYHFMQNYCWMKLAKIVPEITDRVILPIGTVESHGAVAIGSDNIIPNHMADLIWEKCNALIAPSVNHGHTGASISQFPGSITIREEVFEEYIHDVLIGLVSAGFKNILILNGHGGNTEPTKRAMTAIHKQTGVHFMIVDWWKIGFEIASEVYGVEPKQSGHGDLEESALNISKDPGLADKEMYEKLGKDNIGRAGTDAGYYMLPAWATTRYPVEGEGYLDFDVEKAKEYTRKKSDHIADTFLEAINRWEKMESWK